jgi:hypothetical protein
MSQFQAQNHNLSLLWCFAFLVHGMSTTTRWATATTTSATAELVSILIALERADYTRPASFIGSRNLLRLRRPAKPVAAIRHHPHNKTVKRTRN